MSRQRSRAAIYVRISKDVRDGAGVARQETECRELAAARGLGVVRVYNDNDRSASRKRVRRPEFEAMLEAMERGEVDVVLAYATDRLWRRGADLGRLIDAADATDVSVVTITASDIDLSTARGRMVARILATVSEAEVEITSERQEARHRQRRALGLDAGGAVPFGYRKDRVTADPREAKLVREAYARVLDLETTGAIARDWNDRGIPTKLGAQWRDVNLRKMLNRPRYAGLGVDPKTGARYPGSWEPIIDEETYDRAVEILSRRRPKARPRARLLTGFLFCGRCGSVLRAQGDSYGCFRDRGAVGVRATSCGRLRVHAEGSENAIAAAVISRLSGTKSFASALAADIEHGIAALADHSRSIDERLGVLDEMFSNGEIDPARFRKLRGTLLAQAAENASVSGERTAEQALALLPAIEDPESWWNDDRRTNDERRAILRAMLDRIDVAPYDPSLPRRFDPERLEIRWISAPAMEAAIAETA